MKDVYEILGVSRMATDEEIKQAYKAASRANHPDHGGTQEKMSEINDAYHLIDTPEKRAKYNARNAVSNDFNMFSSIFGRPTVAANFAQKPVNRKAINGTDITLDVSIPMHVFVNGFNQMPLEYVRECECLACSGTGGTKGHACPNCGGAGFIKANNRTSKCRKCSGSGMVVTEKCPECDHGMVKKSVKLPIRYTPFTETVTLNGRGNMGRFGGQNGKLIVNFKPTADSSSEWNDGKLYFTGPEIYPEDLVLGKLLTIDVYGKLHHARLPAHSTKTELAMQYDHKYPMVVKLPMKPENDDSPAMELYRKLREQHELN